MSHETIYRSLFVQARGVLKKELLSHLRSKRSMRRSRPVDPNGDKRGHIKDIVSIRQRPAAVEDRAVPGHWEGDLLSGPNNSYIATLVERHTRYVGVDRKLSAHGRNDAFDPERALGRRDFYIWLAFSGCRAGETMEMEVKHRAISHHQNGRVQIALEQKGLPSGSTCDAATSRRKTAVSHGIRAISAIESA